MKYKKALGYLLYAVLLFGYLFMAFYLALALARYNSAHFNITWLIVLAVPVSYIIFGCLLGLDYLIGQTQRNGTWSVKTVRLILLGLPALYFSFYFLMLFYGPIRKPILPILSPQQFVDIAAVVFGYVLITSFQKK
jgi:hypothetical protein